MYALRLSEDNRILEVMSPGYATADTPLVDSYPEGFLYDYKFENGEWVYDPIPNETPETGADAVWDALAAAIREGVNSV